MPKIINHDEYRKKILAKSFNLFTRKGYNNITMEEIAAEIGASKGILYHYFPSKEKMLSEMISWAGLKKVGEYKLRISSVDSVRERFDLAMVFSKENSEFYQNIMLLAVDMYRNSNIEQCKEVYSFFSSHFISLMSEKFNISRQFASSIFLYFLGIIFHSLALDKISEYNKQIDAMSTILKPLIVDAPDDMEKAVHKFNKMCPDFLMNTFVPEKTNAVKENKKIKIKKSVIKQKAGSRKTKQK